MSEIPDDIMRKARETWHDVMGFHNDRGGFVEAIARAILAERERATKAERERCAGIAENYDLFSGSDIFIRGNIAAAIRNRP